MSEFSVIYGVSNRLNNGGSRRSDISNLRRHRRVYGLDANGKFKSEKVGFLKGFWFSRFKTHRFMVVCRQCGEKRSIEARKSDVKGYICVRCSSSKDE